MRQPFIRVLDHVVVLLGLPDIVHLLMTCRLLRNSPVLATIALDANCHSKHFYQNCSIDWLQLIPWYCIEHGSWRACTSSVEHEMLGSENSGMTDMSDSLQFQPWAMGSRVGSFPCQRMQLLSLTGLIRQTYLPWCFKPYGVATDIHCTRPIVVPLWDYRHVNDPSEVTADWTQDQVHVSLNEVQHGLGDAFFAANTSESPFGVHWENIVINVDDQGTTSSTCNCCDTLEPTVSTYRDTVASIYHDWEMAVQARMLEWSMMGLSDQQIEALKFQLHEQMLPLNGFFREDMASQPDEFVMEHIYAHTVASQPANSQTLPRLNWSHVFSPQMRTLCHIFYQPFKIFALHNLTFVRRIPVNWVDPEVYDGDLDSFCVADMVSGITSSGFLCGVFHMVREGRDLPRHPDDWIRRFRIDLTHSQRSQQHNQSSSFRFVGANNPITNPIGGVAHAEAGLHPTAADQMRRNNPSNQNPGHIQPEANDTCHVAKAQSLSERRQEEVEEKKANPGPMRCPLTQNASRSANPVADPPARKQIEGIPAAAKVESDVSGNSDKRRQQLKEASQRSRKRQKQDAVLFTTEISKLRDDLANFKRKLSAPVSSDVKQARELIQERLEMQERIDFVKAKMVEHENWMHKFRNLIAFAPLLDYTLGSPLDDSDPNDMTPAMKRLDEWRKSTNNEVFSQYIVQDRLKTVMISALEHVRMLVRNFTSPMHYFPFGFDSRGWTIRTSSSGSALDFRCDRHLAAVNSPKKVALEMWQSLQREEVLRTFVSVVQDSMIAHECSECSLSRRMIQVGPHDQAQSLVTIESLRPLDTGQRGWMIAVETVTDHYLNMYADIKSSAFPAAVVVAHPVVASGAGKSSQYPLQHVVLGVQVVESAQGGVHACIVGSAGLKVGHTFEAQQDALQLVQYFVSFLPAYEELHLASLA